MAQQAKEATPLSDDESVGDIPALDPVIKLNIGGTRLDTNRSTLLQSGYFRALFSGNFADVEQEDGCYFIDRNGNIFEYLLNYMRCGYVSIPIEYVQDVKREAGFYQIEVDFSGVSEQLIPSELSLRIKNNKTNKLNLESIADIKALPRYGLDTETLRSLKFNGPKLLDYFKTKGFQTIERQIWGKDGEYVDMLMRKPVPSVVCLTKF